MAHGPDPALGRGILDVGMSANCGALQGLLWRGVPSVDYSGSQPEVLPTPGVSYFQQLVHKELKLLTF